MFAKVFTDAVGNHGQLLITIRPNPLNNGKFLVLCEHELKDIGIITMAYQYDTMVEARELFDKINEERVLELVELMLEELLSESEKVTRYNKKDLN